MASNAKLNQIRSKLRNAQAKLQRDVNRLKYEARHPMITLSCGCGHTWKFRYPGHSVRQQCSRCGRTITLT